MNAKKHLQAARDRLHFAISCHIWLGHHPPGLGSRIGWYGKPPNGSREPRARWRGLRDDIRRRRGDGRLPKLKYYDPKSVRVTVGGVELSGFASGDFLEIPPRNLHNDQLDALAYAFHIPRKAPAEVTFNIGTDPEAWANLRNLWLEQWPIAKRHFEQARIVDGAALLTPAELDALELAEDFPAFLAMVGRKPEALATVREIDSEIRKDVAAEIERLSEASRIPYSNESVDETARRILADLEALDPGSTSRR